MFIWKKTGSPMLLSNSENNNSNNRSSWINWISDFESASGYSEGVRAMMKALFENNLYAKTQNRDFGHKIKMKEDIQLIYEVFKEAQLDNRHITIQTLPPSDFVIDNGAYLNIGRTADESTGISEEWVDQCNKMDEIWVPSSFNRETFIDSGVSPEKVCVVPEAIDLDLYDFNAKPLFIEGEKEFNFLSIFDWRLKKGWDVLIESFVNEFSSKDNISLIIRTYSSLKVPYREIKEKINEIILKKSNKNLFEAPRIILIEKMLSQEEMVGLYKSCDCFVLPTRGEGWGRPFQEAMVMGLPVIGTGWGGQTDFMNKENSFLIDYELDYVSTAGYFEMPWFKNKKWANPSVLHLMKLMRFVYDNQGLAKEKGDIAMKEIVSTYNCKAVGKLIADKLNLLKDWDKKIFTLFISRENEKKFNIFSIENDIFTKARQGNFFDLKTYSDFSEVKEEVSLCNPKFCFNIHVNEYSENNDLGSFHNILLMDNKVLSDKLIKNNDQKFLNKIKYKIDDLWVDSQSGNRFNDDHLIDKYFNDREILIIEFNYFVEETLKNIKDRLIRIKKAPIKRFLDLKNLEKIMKSPILIPELKEIKCLLYSEIDFDFDFINFIINFIRKNQNNDKVSLLICVNPGKAREFFKSLEDCFKVNNLILSDTPDVVIFDEVIAEVDIGKLIYNTDFYISNKSEFNDVFINYALRLDKTILDFNYFKTD